MLKEYEARRDLKRTPEPAPVEPAERHGPLTFVVHKHAARRLHYDLRLELDGALKSWAIPNGPSTDPKEKRLAVQVEDHPLEYVGFEGVIPPGQYGAGQVIIWDNGEYSPEDDGKVFFDDRVKAGEIMRAGLESGRLKLTFRGKKLSGSWALVRMNSGEKTGSLSNTLEIVVRWVISWLWTHRSFPALQSKT